MRVAVAIIAAVGTVLRGILLERQSFWYDEAFSAWLARQSILSLVTGRARDLGNPPLYPVLLRLWSSVFGTSDAMLRALSGAASVTSIPLMFLVARRLVGERAALIAAAVLALSPMHVYFAQEARAYAVVVMLCLVSYEMLLRGLEAPARRLPWVGYGIATFLSIYAHYYAFFVVLAQVVHVLVEHRRNRGALSRAALSLAAAAVLYLTWLPSLLGQVTTQGNLARSAETWQLHILSTPLVFSVGTTLLWKDDVSALGIAAACVALMGFGAAAFFGVRALGARRPARRLLLLWLAAPTLIPLCISALAFPFYCVRYGLLASPALYILIAVGLEHMSRKARLAVLMAMALTTAMSLHRYYTSSLKHEWRTAVRWVGERAQPGDVLVFDADIGETAFAHYEAPPRRHVRLLPPVAGSVTQVFYGALAMGEQPHDVTAQVLSGDRVWLILSDVRLGSRGQYKGIFDRTFRRASSKAFRGIEVRLYERADAAPDEAM